MSRRAGRALNLGPTQWRGSPPYRVTVTPSGPPHPPSIGPVRGTPFSAMCKADQVVVGFFGREGFSLDQVGFRCAPLSIDMGPPATLVRGPTDPSLLGPWPSTMGGLEFAEECGIALGVVGVATGYSVRYDDITWIYEADLHCTRPRLIP